MIGRRSCIALLLTMLITLTAGATAYDATSVKMCTSAGNIDMVKIGMTADSCGIWVCRNIDKDADGVRWKMDDMVYVTSPTKKFVTNTLYQLANYTDLLNYDRAIVGDTTVYVYLRAKGQEHAQCFLWDGDTLPDFASQFQITGSVTADVADAYYGDDCYIHMLKYQISGMSEEAFDHYSIELSYDRGKTWKTYTDNATLMNATLPIMLPLEENTVRYRIKAYVKDVYQAAWNDSTWTYETSDYKIAPISRLRYEASKVMMNTGALWGTDIYFSLLGATKDGYQIWGAQGIDKHISTYWKVDNGARLSANLNSFYPYTIYNNLTSGYNDTDRSIEEGTQWYHFVKPKSKSNIDYFMWDQNKRFHPYSFYLYADIWPVCDE